MPPFGLTAGQVLIALVVLQRLAELILARRNTQRLRAAGGIEAGARHYPLFVLLHGAWLAVLAVIAWRDTPPLNWIWVSVFLLLQVGRLWVITTLGVRWTTRVIVLPGTPRVRHGPYRFHTHPNYAIVAAEIAVLPLAFGAWLVALVFSLLNGALLVHRIRVENRALAASEAHGPR